MVLTLEIVNILLVCSTDIIIDMILNFIAILIIA